MNINFGGFVPVSTVDWYGSAVCVVFLRGCPLTCVDCQNPKLIKGSTDVSLDYIKGLIKESESIISGVVFSGGEPLQQIKQLEKLIDWCIPRELKIYIHTSGVYPRHLKKIIDKVDGIRLDYKPMEQFRGKKSHDVYYKQFLKSRALIRGKDHWISSVALRRNESLLDVYKEVGVNFITQGTEEYPKTPNEIKYEFPGVWICTRQEGLKENR